MGALSSIGLEWLGASMPGIICFGEVALTARDVWPTFCGLEAGCWGVDIYKGLLWESENCWGYGGKRWCCGEYCDSRCSALLANDIEKGSLGPFSESGITCFGEIPTSFGGLDTGCWWVYTGLVLTVDSCLGYGCNCRCCVELFDSWCCELFANGGETGSWSLCCCCVTVGETAVTWGSCWELLLSAGDVCNCSLLVLPGMLLVTTGCDMAFFSNLKHCTQNHQYNNYRTTAQRDIIQWNQCKN